MGRFEPLIGYGLTHVLRADPSVRILDATVTGALGDPGQPAPRVMIVDETVNCSLRQRLIESGKAIVMLARAPKLPYGMVLLEAGASCLALSATAEDVLAAVRIGAQGGCVFVSGSGDRLERQDRRERVLTKREVDVLRRLGCGMSYRKIAHELEISAATVNKHARSLMSKLQASRRELAALPVAWLDHPAKREHRGR